MKENASVAAERGSPVTRRKGLRNSPQLSQQELTEALAQQHLQTSNARAHESSNAMAEAAAAIFEGGSNLSKMQRVQVRRSYFVSTSSVGNDALVVTSGTVRTQALEFLAESTAESKRKVREMFCFFSASVH